MDDSSPPTPELPERKNRLSSNSGIKRNKVSRACDECRKRKVRCDGAQPCARCQKSSTECIFSNVTPKRGPPKQYLEPFETRLKTIDKVLQVLQFTSDDISSNDDLNNNHWEAKDPMVEATAHLDVSSIGHALYTPNYPAQVDEQHNNLHTEPPQPSNLNINILFAPQRLDLIQSYFDHIHPSSPFISRATLAQPQPPPLLLNAIYAVSSRFITNTKSNSNNDPPGWSYYKTAIGLIDIYADVPRLTTVQALLLLAKYHEHIQRPGFFWRTKFYIQLAVKMSNDLGLVHEPSSQAEPTWDHEFELRRRTFWALYTYEVLMSTEHGLKIELPQKECTVNYPHVLPIESNHDANAVLDFYWLSKVIHTQACVVQFMRSRYSSNKEEETTNEFPILEKRLNELGDSIPPLEEKSSIHAAFTLIIYHLTTILLLKPFSSDDNMYSSRCLSSADIITQLVDHRLQTEGLDSFYTVARGIQQMIYCLTAALTVQRSLRHVSDAVNESYERTRSFLQMFVAKSPVTDIETNTQEPSTAPPSNASSTRSSPLIPALSSPHSPSLPAPTIRKRHSRSSLQYPASDVNYVMQGSSTLVPEMMNHHRMRSAGRSPYANNRLSAPLLGSLFQQSPYYLQMQQQQQQQQMQQQMQHQHLHQQPISSYSQPSSPTASQFNTEYHTTMQTFPVTPRRTTSLSRKTGLRRSASSTGEFVVPSQQSQSGQQQIQQGQQQQQSSQRSRQTGPYMNPRRHTLTSTPPDIAPPPPSPRNLHAMAVRNHRFSAPVMTDNTQPPYTIPITQHQQHYHQQHQSMMLDPSFPMDPVIPDSPNESMMGLLLNPWDFSSQQQP